MPSKIMIEIREERGVWYATSPDMPGFLLCSPVRAKLEADIYPAMKQLLAIKAEHQNVYSLNRAADKLVERRELAIAA